MTNPLEDENDINKDEKESRHLGDGRPSVTSIIFSYLSLWVVAYILSSLFSMSVFRLDGGDGLLGFTRLIGSALNFSFSNTISGLVLIFSLFMTLRGILYDVVDRQYSRLWLAGLGGVIASVSPIFGFLLAFGTSAVG